MILIKIKNFEKNYFEILLCSKFTYFYWHESVKKVKISNFIFLKIRRTV